MNICLYRECIQACACLLNDDFFSMSQSKRKLCYNIVSIRDYICNQLYTGLEIFAYTRLKFGSDSRTSPITNCPPQRSSNAFLQIEDVGCRDNNVKQYRCCSLCY